jgi:hypothetical protein
MSTHDQATGIDPRLVCAWCRKEMHAGTAGHGVTHGICGPCAARVLAEEERRRLAVLAGKS